MIGVFDSGSGGLTVVKALRKLAPQLDIIYLGDTANMPYGEKSDTEIAQLTLRAIGFLRQQGATTIVSACNSVSAAVIRPMIELLGVQSSSVVEMVGPAIEELARRGLVHATLLATSATVRSGMYASLAQKKGIELECVACPLLAELIETNVPSGEIKHEIRRAMTSIPSSAETILLGCTHYPLVLELFEEVALEQDRSCIFIDPAEAVASTAILRHGAMGSGLLRLLTTRASPSFMESARSLSLMTKDEVEVVRLGNSSGMQVESETTIVASRAGV